nr:Lrp/AsnC family transcriptional regulator [Sphingomonas jatrophae]
MLAPALCQLAAPALSEPRLIIIRNSPSPDRDVLVCVSGPRGVTTPLACDRTCALAGRGAACRFREGGAISKRSLDEHDEAIIELLREDGRMPLQDIAARVNLNDATVRSRIRRLEQSGSIRIVARLDLAARGFPYTALIGLKVRGRTLEEVGGDLLKLPQVISILSVIGRYDLEIQVIGSSLDELGEQLNGVIRAIDGVVAVESALALKIHKYVQPWGRFDETD